jgi:copper chaperone
MRDANILVGGMSCGHCVAAVRGALARLEGVDVRGVEVGSVSLAYDADVVTMEHIAGAIEAEGYTVAAPGASA